MTLTSSFIRNRVGGGVVEVVDEILSRDPNVAGLVINWHYFGSSGQEKADYSRGVLERFTRRASDDWVYSPRKPNTPGCNAVVKTIANPRAINFLPSPHFANYFEKYFAVNEKGGFIQGAINLPLTVDKIVVNHYHAKSREEHAKKVQRGQADSLINSYNVESFEIFDRNEIFDDGILKYRDTRAKVYRPPDNSHADERLLKALTKNLSPMILPTVPPSFYSGKLETFLTCRAVSAYLRGKFPNDERLKVYEEASLKATLKSLSNMTFADARLLLAELPNILPLPYPVVNDLRGACLNIIPQIMEAMHLNNLWKDYVELDYLQRLLQTWK